MKEYAYKLVERTLRVKNVQLGTKQETQVANLSGHYVQVTEIDGVAGAWNARSMLRDAKYVEPFLLSGCHHFLQAAVGMAAHDGVRVDVK